MDVSQIKKRTDLSRAKKPDLSDPTRKESVLVYTPEHAVILQMNNDDPYADETRSFRVGIVVPRQGFPATPPADPDTGVVSSAFEFVTNAAGRVRLFDAFCVPDLRAKHYAQWLWDGAFDSAAPVYVKKMRTVNLYVSSGFLFCEYAGRPKYTQMRGGFVPSDCYINQVT